MKRLYSILSILLLCAAAHAQPYETNPDFKRANHWLFGSHVWLDFNKNPPLNKDSSKLNSVMASTSISDKYGNLLLYSDGVTIWNSSHNIIINGNSIEGHPSSSQGAVFTSHPNNDSIVYLFTTDNHCNSNGFKYSIIKLETETDSTKVVEKNIAILNDVVETIAVTKHDNGLDIWIVVRSSIKNEFYSFLLTKEGLVMCPIISKTTNDLDGNHFRCRTKSNFNKEGTKYLFLSSLNNYVEFFYFDKTKGILFFKNKFEGLTIPSGVEFSNNDSFAYILERDETVIRLNLYNVKKDTVYIISDPSLKFIGISKAVNDVLYINVIDADTLATLVEFENSTIDFKLKGHGISTNTQKFLTNDLPNFNKSCFYTPSINFKVKLNCTNNAIQLYGQDTFTATTHDWFITKQGVNPITSNIKAPLIEFEDSGVYNVRYIASNGTRSDTISKEVHLLPKIDNNFLGNDTGWCEQLGANITIQAPQGMHCYQWNTGETGTQINVDSSGVYSVMITTPNFCVLYDTLIVIVDTIPNVPIIYKDNDTLKTDEVFPFYQWLKDGSPTGTNSPKLVLTDTGIYRLSIRNNGGCIALSDTIHIPDTSNINVKVIVFHNIKVYPNPFNSNIIIEQNSDVQNIQIRIFNQVGKCMYSETTKEEIELINTEGFANGLYFIEIIVPNGISRTFKLIKI